MKHFILLLFLAASLHLKAQEVIGEQIRTGAEQTEIYLPILPNKRTALVVNHTSRIGERHLADTLQAMGVKLTAIFAPEHGFRGEADAGESIANGHDSKTGLPIYSLYGKQKKPLPSQLTDTDAVIFDIQDVGARFYTYLSTLFYVMQACAEQHKELIILDRPNPCDYVAGPILEKKQRSFVGMIPIPILHGCTLGELARMINGEGWLGTKSTCPLCVIPVKGWKHGEPYALPVKPSPNLPTSLSIAYYASLCPFEGTDISVGRGTYLPFQLAGSPTLKNNTSSIRNLFPEADTISFRPVSLPGWDKHPLHQNTVCYGITFTQETTRGFTLKYIAGLYKIYEDMHQTFFTRPQWFDLLMGTDKVRKALQAGHRYQDIERTWNDQLSAYKNMRKKYLLYADTGN